MYATGTTEGIYVGPATVTGAGGGKVRLATPAGPAEATMALAYPYSPRRGDVVLVFGESDLYVIGVLRARGESSLTFPGDVTIRAGGKLSIEGAEGVEVRSPAIRLRADKVEIAARARFDGVMDAYRWVSGVAQTPATRLRTVVSGTASLQAERIIETASKDVRIDGERINLG